MLTKFISPFNATEKDISKINSYSRRKLNLNEIYTFSVVLCNNDIDRDCEAFTKDSLIAMAKLFNGKTGIMDHKTSSKNQVARIYKTSVIKTDEKTLYGDDKYILKGWAYMVRSDTTKDLILKIDAGIVKEVSVSCSISKKLCSICGSPYDGSCNHILGKRYNDKICFVKLETPLDAYEWSFVAVPSQIEAGVVKHFSTKINEDSEFQKQAHAGLCYENLLKTKLIKLAFLKGFMTKNDCFKDIVEKLSVKEMQAFVDELSKNLNQKDFKPSLTSTSCEKYDNTCDFIF